MLDTISKSLKEFLETDTKSNQKSNQKILSLIKKDNKITIKQICEKTKLSESGVKKVIKKLKDEEKLVRVGSLKGGHWEVKEQ
jgi:predicted HTH transcriptional regulator